MGTRSDIIVHRTDGKWARIYCHWDGYLSHNGRILFDHYKDQKKVEKLVELGVLSSLKENIGRKHSFESRTRTMCTFYGRDRGEKDVDAKVGNLIDEVWPESESWTEFTYVWASATFPDETEERFGWFVGDPGQGTGRLGSSQGRPGGGQEGREPHQVGHQGPLGHYRQEGLMVHFRHKTIVVSSHLSVEHAREAHEAAVRILGKYPSAALPTESLVSNLVVHIVNGGGSFFISPDGSKLGWDTSIGVSEAREKFIQWLNNSVRPYDWALIVLGGDDDKFEVIDHSGKVDESHD